MNTAPKKKGFTTALLVIAILVIGGAAGAFMVLTKPTTKRVRPPASNPLVSTFAVKRDTASLMVEALGTVKADQETVVRVRVSGQVEELGPNFDVGGLVQKDALLLRIDASDYENALALKESLLAKAKADYDLEMGQQRVARTEVAQLNKTAPNAIRSTSLALRAPQLAQAKATLQSAEVEVKQAQLDLSRTKVTVPYNAIVISRNVSLGSQASLSDSIATLAGTDTYYIEAAIPLDKLQGLGLGIFDNTLAKVYTTTGAVREGRVRHSIASLDETTRMGRVLVEVKDPLALYSDAPQLILGDHVRVELQAGSLNDVIELPRGVLRGNDNVWVAKKMEDGSTRLDIRTVEVLWKDTQIALVGKGLTQGELVVTSPLGGPIQNMPVRLEGQALPTGDKKQGEMAGQKRQAGQQRPEGAQGGDGQRGQRGQGKPAEKASSETPAVSKQSAE